MQSFKLKFLGVKILQGVEFPIFLLIFEWALQQCSATLLPVIFTTSSNQQGCDGVGVPGVRVLAQSRSLGVSHLKETPTPGPICFI